MQPHFLHTAGQETGAPDFGRPHGSPSEPPVPVQPADTPAFQVREHGGGEAA